MGDMKEVFNDMKQASKDKRESNRNSGAAYLERFLIPFEIKNNGAHLIVEGSKGFIDYWPGTGKWIARTGIKGFGVKALIKAIQTEQRI